MTLRRKLYKVYPLSIFNLDKEYFLTWKVFSDPHAVRIKAITLDGEDMIRTWEIIPELDYCPTVEVIWYSQDIETLPRSIQRHINRVASIVKQESQTDYKHRLGQDND